jgi:hypothetical protein
MCKTIIIRFRFTTTGYPAEASLHNTMPQHLQPDNEDDTNQVQCPTLVL